MNFKAPLFSSIYRILAEIQRSVTVHNIRLKVEIPLVRQVPGSQIFEKMPCGGIILVDDVGSRDHKIDIDHPYPGAERAIQDDKDAGRV